jgi:hypothetical protein
MWLYFVDQIEYFPENTELLCGYKYFCLNVVLREYFHPLGMLRPYTRTRARRCLLASRE